MAFIIIIAIIIYFILIYWNWQSLGNIENNKKILYIIIEVVIMYIFTLVIFNISKSGITYENLEIENSIKNILVAIFTGINGIIIMPKIGKILEKINENEIKKKEEFQKRIIILMITVIIFVIFEIGYIKDTQKGILEIYYKRGRYFFAIR